MINKKDYYKILDVNKETKIKDIKKSYKDKAKELNVNVDMENKNDFIELCEAAIVLTDKKKKRLYDNGGFEKVYGNNLENYTVLSFDDSYKFFMGKYKDTNNKIFLNKFTNFQEKVYGLTTSGFNFKSLKWKTDGLIFLASTLFFPFLISVMAKLLFTWSDKTETALQFIYIISVTVGAIVLIAYHKSGYFKYGYAWQFLFVIIPLLALILVIAFSNANQYILAMVVNLVPKFILLILILYIDKKTRKIIIETFKKHWLTLLITCVFGFIIIIGINLLVSGVIEQKLFKLAESKNESNLAGALSDQNASKTTKITYAILLVLYAVMVAPFVEEMAFRSAWFLNVSNKWLAYVTSSIAFGFIHYGFSGDFEHVLSYSAGGFILGGVFIWTKGNITYSWLVHMGNNLFAVIVLLVSVSW
ncbi:CPBP family glutamic-type intramembrane protease [Spiroplasma tabanidicola]|uniref:CAAX amino terminal membrane bound protease n=1 Tax=Spiroplasma tabanidicola TaxID=324079 RepID=A0A6I6C9G8_9MOLU|nr:CPBP family glutamic-type intramembrane protease [Spiroplasma tabanidicola]QGS51565.1 CAAX amino terminal membrane bound protease [Spiroplasma tabanidicola]